MRLGKDTADKSFIFKNLVMRITKEQKILVLLYTANGTVKVTLRNYVKKASKIGGLSRLPNYLNDSEKKLVFNSIVKSQLSYCRLV